MLNLEEKKEYTSMVPWERICSDVEVTDVSFCSCCSNRLWWRQMGQHVGADHCMTSGLDTVRTFTGDSTLWREEKNKRQEQWRIEKSWSKEKHVALQAVTDHQKENDRNGGTAEREIVRNKKRAPEAHMGSSENSWRMDGDRLTDMCLATLFVQIW